MCVSRDYKQLCADLDVHPASSIFVVADKSRLDVAKAIITGPTGTPYSGGVFEFDVLFPADYPQSPPLVHFDTGARSMRRFNPNL